MDRTKRLSVSSKLRTSSLSSSEEEEEEEEESDGTEALPTPGTAGTFDGFTNPWAGAGTVTGGKAIDLTFTPGEAPRLGHPI